MRICLSRTAATIDSLISTPHVANEASTSYELSAIEAKWQSYQEDAHVFHAIAVHTEDERYAPFVGKSERVPLIDRVVLVIAEGQSVEEMTLLGTGNERRRDDRARRAQRVLTRKSVTGVQVNATAKAQAAGE